MKNKELSYKDLMERVGLPVFDQWTKCWMIIESADDEEITFHDGSFVLNDPDCFKKRFYDKWMAFTDRELKTMTLLNLLDTYKGNLQLIRETEAIDYEHKIFLLRKMKFEVIDLLKDDLSNAEHSLIEQTVQSFCSTIKTLESIIGKEKRNDQ